LNINTSIPVPHHIYTTFNLKYKFKVALAKCSVAFKLFGKCCLAGISAPAATPAAIGASRRAAPTGPAAAIGWRGTGAGPVVRDWSLPRTREIKNNRM
jgi:hypothetical protein